MTDPHALLEAHVTFELARWSGERLDETVREQVAAVREWLEATPLSAVAPAEEVAATAGRIAGGLVLTDEVIAAVAEGIASGQAALAEHPATVGEVVDVADYEAIVDLVAGQESVRSAAITAVTASKGYRKLVSHVLYQGVKGYLLTENVFARKVPGASTLVRLGQRTMSTAAPNLGDGLDRTLTAFVEANLSETLKESRRYLEATLTVDLIGEMAEEVWATVADRPVGELVGVVDPDDTFALAVAVAPLLRRWRDEGVLAQVVESVALAELTRYEDWTVGELLDEWGIDVASAAGDVVELLRPALEHAHESGFLEARVRAQLEPFYATL